MSDHRSTSYGWRVVAVASLGLFLGHGPVVVFSFGVFLNQLAQNFHASRAAVSFAFTLQSVVAAAGVPFIGRLIDRFGARRFIVAGTTLFGTILLTSQLVGTDIVWLYLFFLALGLVGVCTSPVPYGVVVAGWFDRQRGLALGLMASGLGLGAIAIPVIAQRVISSFGWRVAYAGFGCAVLLISLPAVALVLREQPRQPRRPPTGVVPEDRAMQPIHQDEGLHWREIWHQRTFWQLVCSFFFAGASLHACVAHIPALLTDRGASAEAAAGVSALIGAAVLVGRLGAGYLLDRVFAPRLAMAGFGGAAVGMGLLSAGVTGPTALVAAVLIGIGMGAEVDIIAYLLSRYFGLRSLGTAFGVSFGSYLLAGAIGVLLMGAGFDATHAYAVPLAGFFVAMLLATGLMSGLGPYRYVPEQSRGPW